MKIQKTNHENMIKAGVILLVSTDAGIQNPVLTAESDNPSVLVDPRTKLGEGHFNALLAFEERGMQPMEILKSATIHIARAYELEDEIGTLESGKIADIVILDANPLRNARNYRRIHSVIKNGQVVDLEALPVAPIISSMKVPDMKTDNETR
jgi:imidazolonepropionase-like amidohydrolase